MKSLIGLSIGLAMLSSAAFAENMSSGHAELMTTIPSDSLTVTDWYKQNVYDPNNNKIGEIMDVLVSPEGHITTLIVGVGGFLGAGEKDVAVNFTSVKRTMKDNKATLTMDTTKDSLKSAPGYKYDRTTTTWVPDNSKSSSK